MKKHQARRPLITLSMKDLRQVAGGVDVTPMKISGGNVKAEVITIPK
jgi:hypothetical protein